MKKTYSTPLVTATDVVRDTLAGVITTGPSENKSTSFVLGVGFGL